MQLLAAISDVNDLVRRPGLDAVVDRGEVGGGVVRRAVGLLHHRGHRRPLAVALDHERVFLFRQGAIGENAPRAFALLRDALVAELLHDVLELRVVEALAERNIEAHAEATIDGVELRLREADHLVPEREVLRVAGLELHQFLPRGFEGGGVFLATRGDQLVDALHFAERVGGERFLV